MHVYTSLGSILSLYETGRVKNINDVMTMISSAGLDGLEINIRIFGLLKRRYPALSFSLHDLDCSKISLHSNHIDFNPGSSNLYTRTAGINQLKEEIKIAESFKIRTLTIHPGWVKKIPREEALELFHNSLQEIYDDCSISHTRICLENMDDKPEKLCSTIDEIALTLDKFPLLSLTVDFAHLGLTGMDPGSFINEFEDRIAHIHISGAIKGMPHSRVPLKDSIIDFTPAIRHFSKKDIIMVIENNSWDVMLKSKVFIENALNTE